MTFPEALQLGYQIGLAALTTCVLLTGSGQMKRTIIAVFAVFVAPWLLKGWWPTEAYSYAMVTVDALAAWIILYHPAGKWQSGRHFYFLGGTKWVSGITTASHWGLAGE